eukprot:4090305-Pyramimonas_sp.AAC.1
MWQSRPLRARLAKPPPAHLLCRAFGGGEPSPQRGGGPSGACPLPNHRSQNLGVRSHLHPHLLSQWIGSSPHHGAEEAAQDMRYPRPTCNT